MWDYAHAGGKRTQISGSTFVSNPQYSISTVEDTTVVAMLKREALPSPPRCVFVGGCGCVRHTYRVNRETDEDDEDIKPSELTGISSIFDSSLFCWDST